MANTTYMSLGIKSGIYNIVVTYMLPPALDTRNAKECTEECHDMCFMVTDLFSAVVVSVASPLRSGKANISCGTLDKPHLTALLESSLPVIESKPNAQYLIMAHPDPHV